jgi:hypothetical protein
MRKKNSHRQETLSRRMDFAYDSSLASDELRLLQPMAVDRNDLRFTTRRVRRASKPHYTAVSYTWGNEDASEIIYLDDRRFRVRPNLWSCLYYMASAARTAAWDYLWVDAICINQTNDAERNFQVRLMDQTYRDAICVSVFAHRNTDKDSRNRWIRLARFDSRSLESPILVPRLGYPGIPTWPKCRGVL